MIIALTGGIATGKTTVARMFADLGAELISADTIAREVLSPGSPTLKAVVDRFGQEILLPDGSLDRSKLADIIFSDAQARADLDSITHPEIISRLRTEVQRFRDSPAAAGRVMMAEVPLLFECGLRPMVDKVIVAASEQGTQRSRLMKRNRLSQEQASVRVSAQMPLGRKTALADWVVWTDGAPRDTARQVRRIWSEIIASAKLLALILNLVL